MPVGRKASQFAEETVSRQGRGALGLAVALNDFPTQLR